jgi:hypothetical protein
MRRRDVLEAGAAALLLPGALVGTATAAPAAAAAAAAAVALVCTGALGSRLIGFPRTSCFKLYVKRDDELTALNTFYTRSSY